MKNIVLLLPLLFLTAMANANPPASHKAMTKVPLTVYLDNQTASLNSYYTIEYYFANGAVPSTLGSAEIEPKPISNIPEFVAYLKEQLPEADVFIDTKHPTIINIVDKKLVQEKDYSLSKPITIHYNGMLSGLPKAIADVTKEDVNYVNSINAAVIFTDSDTIKVDLDLRGTPGREVLTKTAYLPGCNRQLWQGFTSSGNGANHTSIYFPPTHK